MEVPPELLVMVLKSEPLFCVFSSVFDTWTSGPDLHETELRFVLSRLARHVVRPFSRDVGKLIATCVPDETAASTECSYCEELARRIWVLEFSLGSCGALAPLCLPSLLAISASQRVPCGRACFFCFFCV